MRSYLCIDLKSFYASVECVARGLDPLTTNLVVADPERSEKTICLAVSPSMKALGVRNRCRVFEIPEGIDYIMAVPRMQLYIDVSAEIYSVYLRYLSKDDIHVYSIDEAFLDVTDYLVMYRCTARELGIRIMEDIYDKTGITATCGAGTNLYLTKVALDITAKHSPDHIGIQDEESYREQLWDHMPITDFWRIGPGTARRLATMGITTMRGITKMPEEKLYHAFGIDAELLIDHAWGRESTTIADIKAFRATDHSLSSGQVLPCGYSTEDARIVVKEMADNLALELVAQDLLTQSVYLGLSYESNENLPSTDGTDKTIRPTSSSRELIAAVEKLYDRIVIPGAMVRRINLAYLRLTDNAYLQYDLFMDPEDLERENRLQRAAIEIKERFGANAILKGMDLQKNATTRERNEQIGGHKK
jgi:DNA polymerase V